jgi:endonuclease/exonuclease/phosphatase (EEP) superfamily protein YafD
VHGGIWLASVGYLASALAAAALLWYLSDRWWLATVLLFGPRWVLLLPLVVLVPAAFLLDRSLLFPLLVAGVVVLGPVMGLRTGWRSLLPVDASGPTLRLASFNARGGEALLLSPAALLEEWNADLAAFQECGRALGDALRELPGWHVDIRSGLCLVSRFPIAEVAEMEREALEFAGGSGLVATYTIDMDGTTAHVTNLHLETPRAGLERIRSGRLAAGIAKTEERSMLREVEMRRARLWVDGYQGPRVVLGDFNTPPESRFYRDSWGGWQNAFSHRGRGLGGTRLNGWIRARIDHILADASWTVLGSRLGKDAGSDHLPILAELALR